MNQVKEGICECGCNKPAKSAPDGRAKITLGGAMNVICEEIQVDANYAWSWHCNLVTPMMSEGVTQLGANNAAAMIMRDFFGVNMWSHPRFETLMQAIKMEELAIRKEKAEIGAGEIKEGKAEAVPEAAGSVFELGDHLIAFGKALKSPRTEVTELVSLAGRCNLEVGLSINARSGK